MLYPILKRFIDFTLSIIALFVLLPIFFITAIVIKLESKGPVIFQQERIGLNGRVFKIYKFRSMYLGAEKQGVYSGKSDMRVTRVGKLIRAISIDELPQLVNIIKGDMSIIGPRPTLTYHPWPFDEYTEKQKKRFSVRPGLTGWAQINGRKDVPWDQRLEYDIEYVEKLSFGFDLKIFLRTVVMVLTMKGNVNVRETTPKKTDI